jgi:group II intron reverse transcriptase/maturase
MYEELMEEVVNSGNVGPALKAVVRNQGAPGMDRMTTSELEEHLQLHWKKIRAKLLNGTYAVTPVRQVEIPKPGGGVRKLGIPTVLDRFIQQLLLQVLTPIFDPQFSEYSYGFRPGRSAHDAVGQARSYVVVGKDWVVDIDIEKFFDRVHHDILMQRIGKTIRDKRVLKLIGRFLRSGILAEGVVIRQQEGTPQGGPLSPLLANIYLDPLDQELEKRGHSFVRYADDCNVYVGGPASADRLMRSLPKWIEKHLRLKVNAKKSGSGRPWERKFLGFRITREGQLEVSPESLKRLKVRIRQLWDGRLDGTSSELRDRWLLYIWGWWNYYKLAEWRRPVFDLEGWIRRHIRKCFWIRWHNPQGRHNALKRLGIRERDLRVARSSRGAWRIARSPILHRALNNQLLQRYGFLLPSNLAGDNA